jgi:hypothetical protein
MAQAVGHPFDHFVINTLMAPDTGQATHAFIPRLGRGSLRHSKQVGSGGTKPVRAVKVPGPGQIHADSLWKARLMKGATGSQTGMRQ